RLIPPHPRGPRGGLLAFWLPRGEPHEPLLAAVETIIDLDGGVVAGPSEGPLDGHTVAVRDPQNRQVDDLLQCAGFRLDSSWQRYYRDVACTAAMRQQAIHRSLAGVAFDIPMLLALFLLMAIRADLVQMPVSPLRLNAKRSRLGKRPLLAHIEGCCPVFASAAVRRAPRGSITYAVTSSGAVTLSTGADGTGADTCDSAASAAAPSSCGCRAERYCSRNGARRP